VLLAQDRVVREGLEDRPADHGLAGEVGRRDRAEVRLAVDRQLRVLEVVEGEPAGTLAKGTQQGHPRVEGIGRRGDDRHGRRS
jgi:hypothetical protein